MFNLTHRVSQHIPELGYRGGPLDRELTGYNTQSLIVNYNACRIWRVMQSLCTLKTTFS